MAQGERRQRGAPPGNLNSLKYGQYSRQMRRALQSSDPEDWQNFLARLRDDRQRARVDLVVVLLWVNRYSGKSSWFAKLIH
jgi:hypothetical protein